LSISFICKDPKTRKTSSGLDATWGLPGDFLNPARELFKRHLGGIHARKRKQISRDLCKTIWSGWFSWCQSGIGPNQILPSICRPQV